MWICIYLLIAMASAMAVACNVLWIVLKVMAIREGSRLRLHYITRDNIVKLEELIVNQSDPDRRRLYLSLLHICQICYYIFLILSVFVFALFIGYALYQKIKLGVH